MTVISQFMLTIWVIKRIQYSTAVYLYMQLAGRLTSRKLHYALINTWSAMWRSCTQQFKENIHIGFPLEDLNQATKTLKLSLLAAGGGHIHYLVSLLKTVHRISTSNSLFCVSSTSDWDVLAIAGQDIRQVQLTRSFDISCHVIHWEKLNWTCGGFDILCQAAFSHSSWFCWTFGLIWFNNKHTICACLCFCLLSWFLCQVYSVKQ